ncbi:glycosyltransferase family 2 protein [Acidocella sp.]|uniref:glycosyltransferase family 2 protein n=1 Tax=Acidocella sp. TaxID=50710 RepID=UPI003D082428
MPAEAPRRLAGTAPPPGAYDGDINILCLGRLEETKAAIASALAQTGGVFHVSVLDQGSSPEMLHELAACFGRLPGFALYAGESNRGVAAGRNALARLGHGRIVIGLDNDARFADEHVAAGALKRFMAAPELGAIGFCILAADGQGPDLTSWGYPKALLPRYRERFAATCFVGAGHAIRRAAWESVGGYDESFFFAWEEYDFCLAAIARGWRVYHEGRLAVIHDPAREGRVCWRGARMTHFIRNRLIIARKWRQGGLVLAPWLLRYGLVAVLHGCFGAVCAGAGQGLRAPVPTPRKMPGPMRAYIRAHETSQRGTLLTRLRLELFGRLPAKIN